MKYSSKVAIKMHGLLSLIYFAAFITSYPFSMVRRVRFNRQRCRNSNQNELDTEMNSAFYNATFSELFADKIPPWLLNRCEQLGFRYPTIVQEQVMPMIFEKKDVILQSHTGSGKTLAYSIPILSRIDPSRAAVQAVVIVPTRELGLQVASVFRQLASESPKKVLIMTLVEGSNNRR